MTTVPHVPNPQTQISEKRPESEPGQLPEPKLSKLDEGPNQSKHDDDIDTEEKNDHVEDDDHRLSYCIICGIMAEHRIDTCPNKSLGFGIACLVCVGPCKSKNDEHKGSQVEMLKFCLVCRSQAIHWSEDCPWNDPDKMYHKADPNARDLQYSDSDDDDDDTRLVADHCYCVRLSCMMDNHIGKEYKQNILEGSKIVSIASFDI